MSRAISPAACRLVLNLWEASRILESTLTFAMRSLCHNTPRDAVIHITHACEVPARAVSAIPGSERIERCYLTLWPDGERTCCGRLGSSPRQHPQTDNWRMIHKETFSPSLSASL